MSDLLKLRTLRTMWTKESCIRFSVRMIQVSNIILSGVHARLIEVHVEYRYFQVFFAVNVGKENWDLNCSPLNRGCPLKIKLVSLQEDMKCWGISKCEPTL